MKRTQFRILLVFIFVLSNFYISMAQMVNAYGRNIRSLNGEWAAIIDPYDAGRRSHIWENQKPQNKDQFREYSFDEGLKLNVPGDFNSQMPELKYYEGTVWYGKYFDNDETNPNKKMFLYFAGVSNVADVYLNGEYIGHHEGGFTPFQIDITNKVKEKDNFLALAVNNNRRKDSIPAMNFDWWNYGGITRDVFLITVPEQYISDYFIRLDKDNPDEIIVDVALSQPVANESVTISIPELQVSQKLTTDEDGNSNKRVKAKSLKRWDVKNPKLYEVKITTDHDTVTELIGFKTIKTEGSQILLNEKPIFLAGVNFHEEIPQRKGRAFSEADAAMLLNEAKAIGANFIRLAHYPQNEHILRMAEKMGFLIWEEIPIWQEIDFSNDTTLSKAKKMMREMVNRDKNRAAIAIWSIANETWPSESRNNFLFELKNAATDIDNTRLIGAAFNNCDWNGNEFVINDPATDFIDVVGINKYLGWYNNWPKKPSEIKWNVKMDKPLIISEFGGEALYGNNLNGDAKWSWSEDYQADLYQKNLAMFENIPNLTGISPWVLFDFRSPTRFSPEQGLEFNRKGLVSDRGERKQAWYIIKDYYSKKNKL